ncbi:MAG TPA: GAF domain-containing protein, partial [Rubrobacteraceae bacterium]|nr:GAF domain-containing protein [Rubrobacteraceae bacterium]
VREGEDLLFTGIIRDITERKQAGEERELLLARERQARAEAVAMRRRLALLAEAGPMLSASLDYEATLEQITHLTVPRLADCCLVDVVEEDGAVRQLAAAHADPEKEELLHELAERRALDAHELQEKHRLYALVLSTGRPILLPEITDEILVKNSVDESHLALLRKLELKSCICVPLRARGRTLGTIILISSRDDLRYDDEDLSLAESLAYRCALAADNARLYQGRSEMPAPSKEAYYPPACPMYLASRWDCAICRLARWTSVATSTTSSTRG